MKAVIKAALISMFAATCSAVHADEAAVAAKVAATFPGLTAKATVYPGYYALFKSQGGKLVPNNMIVDESVTIIENNGKVGWSDVQTRAPVAPDRVKSINAVLIPRLPADKAIPIVHGKAPFAFILYSAIDCPACVLAERKLAKSKYSYGVFPTSLDEENRSAASDVYCAIDPTAAWTAIMSKRKPAPHRRCDYPEQTIIDTGLIFASTSTPTFIFADGEVHQGYPDTKAEEADLFKLIDSKVAAGTHF